LLSRCNANTKTRPDTRETLRAGEDQDTGCQWCTWTRPGAAAGSFRFYATVQRIVMHGSIRRDGPSEQAAFAHYVAGGLASTAEYRYAFEHKKDLANHVWAVALHCPDTKITVDADGKPTDLPWTLEGVHEASGNALARGKMLWREKLAQKQGRFDRLDSHYGFARYLLVPHAALANSTGAINNKRHSLSSALHLVPSHSTDHTAQIRVERIKVMPQGEMVAMFAPAEAILFDKPFQALCKGRDKGNREAVAKVQAELLDLFSAAGEDVAEHAHQPAQEEKEDFVVVRDLRLLTPPPIRRKSLRSPPQLLPAFREGMVQEYASIWLETAQSEKSPERWQERGER
jgi:hypothetical protein